MSGDIEEGLEGPSLREVLMSAAAASRESHDYQAAVAAYRTLYARSPNDVEVAVEFARNLRFIGRLSQAVTILDRTLKKQPDDARLLAERGKVELARSRPIRALELLDRAVESEPGEWRTHSAIGIARDLLGRYEPARHSYRTALELSPGNPTVLNNLALSQALSSNIDLGIATLTRLVSRPDASAQSRQNLALLHAWKGELRKAENLARRDLPDEMADNNLNYFRGLAATPRRRGPISTPRGSEPRPPQAD